MSGETRLGRDAAAYTFGGMVQLIATLALLPVMTRLLSDQQFGLAVTLQVVTQISVHLASAGLPLASTREYFDSQDGRARSVRLVATTLPIASVAVLMVLATSYAWTRIFDSVDVGMAVLFAVMAAVPRAITATALGNLRARHLVRSFLALSVSNTVGAQLLGVAVAAAFDRSATNYLAGYMLGSLVASIGAWVSTGSGLAWLRWSELRSVLRYALPAVPHTIATLVLQAGDRVVIETTIGVAAVGQYQVAYLLATLPIPAMVAFNNAWSPRLIAAREENRFLEKLQEPAGTMLVAVPCLGAACALVAPVAIHLGLPDTYDASGLRDVVAVVSVVAISFVIYVFASQALLVERRTAALAVVAVVAAATNLGLNSVLVSRHGLVGAALATAVTYVGMAAAVTVIARRRHRYRLPGRQLMTGVGVTLGGALLTSVVGVSGFESILYRSLGLVLLALLGLVALRDRLPRLHT